MIKMIKNKMWIVARSTYF